MTDELTITPLEDLVLEQKGWHLESEYVETFWLPVLGPTSLCLLRKWGRVQRQVPAWTVERTILAKSLGVGHRDGNKSPLNHTLDRLCQFFIAQWEDDERSHISIRRALPDVPERKTRSFHATMQIAHEFFLKSQRGTSDETEQDRDDREAGLPYT